MQTILGSAVENIDTLEIAYLQSLGATSNQVNNAWMEVFLANGATSVNWNVAANQFLIALGATGTNLPDNWYWFWVVNGGAVGGGTFEEQVAATNPVAWYDTQETNYQTEPLHDRSGNGWDLPRNSTARATGTGAPFTTAKTKSIAFDGVWASNAYYWIDTPANLAQYSSNIPHVTLTFTMRYRSLTLNWAMICGWRQTSSASILAATSQNPSGDNVTCWSKNNSNQSLSSWYNTPDMDIHIFTFRYSLGIATIFKDGAAIGSNIHTVKNNTYSGAPKFQVGGTFTGAFGGLFDIDHVHINNSAVDDSTIIGTHESFIAELV
jgi:hypothetical protein